MRTVLIAIALLLAAPVLARDSLGVFESWGAFRDPETPRCYAIAAPDDLVGRPSHRAFASVGFWPRQEVRGQVFFRLSRPKSDRAGVTATIGSREFELTGSGADVWAKDRRMDAAIVAAIRSSLRLAIRTTGADGRPIKDRYPLRGAATAIDAASLGCSRLR